MHSKEHRPTTLTHHQKVWVVVHPMGRKCIFMIYPKVHVSAGQILPMPLNRAGLPCCEDPRNLILHGDVIANRTVTAARATSQYYAHAQAISQACSVVI